MNSKTSCFNICGAMIRENMRRFWPIPVIGFLIYFLSGVFPILMNYEKLKIISSYIDLTFKNQHPFFLAAHLFLPVTAAILVFRYLHSNASVSVMHAMPFTRTCLFGSNFLSGFLLCLSPVLLNGLILLCIAKPVYMKKYNYNAAAGENVEEVVNVFSRHAILSWFLSSCVILLFVFAVAVFAGIVTGNGLMHFLAALGFQFLVPMLYLTFLYYFNTFLFGFSYWDSASEIFLKLSPYLYIFADDKVFSIGSCALYTGIAACIILLSLLLYRRRKLERAGDSLVFSFMQPVICFIITFFSMTLFGLYFSMMNESQLYKYAGYVGGALVGFLVAQMIVRKTVRIFDGKSMKRFAVYCAAALLFFCSLTFDITGYEHRIPDLTSVSSVTVNQNFLSNIYYSYEGEEKEINRNTFKETENMILAQDFHKQLIKDRALFEKEDDTLRRGEVNFVYQMKNGSRFTRTYQVPFALFRSYSQLAPLYESAEYRKLPSIASVDADDFNYLTIHSSYMPGSRDGYAYETVTDKERIHSLAQALAHDLTNRSFSEMSAQPIPLCSLEFGYADRRDKQKTLNHTPRTNAAYPQLAAKTYFTAENTGSTDSFNVYSDYTEVLAWLSENGLDNYTKLPGNFAAYMVVECQTSDSERSAPYWNGSLPRLGDPESIPTSDENSLIITDQNEMNEILAHCETTMLDNENFYIISLLNSDMNYAAYKQSGYFRTDEFYLNLDDAPEKIRDYFL